MQLLEYKESKPRGSFGFPVEIYHVNCHHPQYIMGYHWHEEHELIRVLEGSFTYVVEEEHGVLQAGDILFVNSGFLHAGVPGACVYECIVFNLENSAGEVPLMPELRQFAQHQRTVARRFSSEDEEIKQLVNQTFAQLAQKQEGYQLVVRGLLYQLFGRIVAQGYYEERPPESWVASKKMRQLKRVLALIEEEYASPLTLEQLAQAAGMTPKYFCHFFQGMTGRTPIDYLNHHRIEVASVRLATGHAQVTELAYECGYNDLSYFIRVFKKYKGVTPKQYTKQRLAPG